MNDKFNVPTKEQTGQMYLSINDEVGTDKYELYDTFRHSLALMEIMQTLLKMQIEVKQARLERMNNEKLKITDERLARLLKLTIHLDDMADMNVQYQYAFREMGFANTKLQSENQKLREQIKNYTDAMEAADNDTITTC